MSHNNNTPLTLVTVNGKRIDSASIMQHDLPATQHTTQSLTQQGATSTLIPDIMQRHPDCWLLADLTLPEEHYLYEQLQQVLEQHPVFDKISPKERDAGLLLVNALIALAANFNTDVAIKEGSDFIDVQQTFNTLFATPAGRFLTLSDRLTAQETVQLKSHLLINATHKLLNEALAQGMPDDPCPAIFLSQLNFLPDLNAQIDPEILMTIHEKAKAVGLEKPDSSIKDHIDEYVFSIMLALQILVGTLGTSSLHNTSELSIEQIILHMLSASPGFDKLATNPKKLHQTIYDLRQNALTDEVIRILYWSQEVS